MEKQIRLCVNCAGENLAQPKLKFISVLAYLRDSKSVTVYQALNELLTIINPYAPIQPIQERHQERRFICIPCWGKLTKLYNAYNNFFSATSTSPASYVQSKIMFDGGGAQNPEETDVAAAAAPNAPTKETNDVGTQVCKSLTNPASAKRLGTAKFLNKISNDEKEVQILRNWIAKKIRSEMDALAKLPDEEFFPLVPENERSESSESSASPENIDWKSLDRRLVVKAPYTRDFILIMGDRSKRIKNAEFSPKIGTAFYILMNSSNMFKTNLQKMISSLLQIFKKKNKYVYGQLNQLGICTSYRSMDRVKTTAVVDVVVPEIANQIEVQTPVPTHNKTNTPKKNVSTKKRSEPPTITRSSRIAKKAKHQVDAPEPGPESEYMPIYTVL